MLQQFFLLCFYVGEGGFCSVYWSFIVWLEWCSGFGAKGRPFFIPPFLMKNEIYDFMWNGLVGRKEMSDFLWYSGVFGWID